MKPNLATLAKDGFGSLVNLLYPPLCGICNKKLLTGQEAALLICKDCLAKIKKNPPPHCKKCGRSLCGLTDNIETCWECFDRNFYFERSWSGFFYEGVVKEALHLLKYSGKIFLSNLFSNLLIQFLKNNIEILEGIDGVISVPLHSVKLREREFNQAHILVEVITKEFKLKDLSRCLKRTKVTRPQSELDKKERFNNVKGTFEIPVSTYEVVCGKNILIVDDIFTTGATLNECARVLKKAGVKKIRCLTFARGA